MTPNARLRPNLRFIQQTQDGVVTNVVKDPVTLKYFKFGNSEVALMHLFDGTRSFDEIVLAARDQLGMATSADAVERFTHRLKEMGLVERSQEERSVLLMEFVRKDRKSRMKGDGQTVLRMRFSLGDPDELLTWMNKAFPFFFKPPFIIGSVVLFAAYALILATHWPQFTTGLSAMYDFSHFTPAFVLMLYGTLCVIFTVHEFGHGLTCKHFGGEVHELGVMLIYFMPAFFCNVNDAWTFEKKSERLWVTFAGGWIQLVMAAFAAIVWITTEPGTIVNEFALLSMVIGGGLALLLNFNPLLPLDGYYAILDYTGIPNLRKRALEFAPIRLKQIITRKPGPLPMATPREARIFLIYGTLTLMYIVLVLSLVSLKLGTGMFHTWGWWGLAIFLWLVYRATGGLRKQIRTGIANMDAAKWQKRISGWLSPKRAAVVAAVLILPFVIPWTVKVKGPAVVESVQRAFLRPPEEGRVERTLVKEGDIVKAGQPLLILRNPELELEWTRARAAVDVLDREVGAAAARGDNAAVQAAVLELNARSDIANRLRARREALVLRAPFPARIVTAHPEELVGYQSEVGDSLLELESTGPLQARLSLAQRDIADIARGNRVHIKFPVEASSTWRTHIAEIAAAARDGKVEVLVPLAQNDSAGPLMAGMVGVGKVAVRRTNLSGAFMRIVRRTLRTDLLI